MTKIRALEIILTRHGNCEGLIYQCNPFAHRKADESKAYTCKSSKRGMSVLWLEAIATNLGAFIPLSEREFLVEALYDKDPDGYNHVELLSALIMDFWEFPL